MARNGFVGGKARFHGPWWTLPVQRLARLVSASTRRGLGTTASAAVAKRHHVLFNSLLLNVQRYRFVVFTSVNLDCCINKILLLRSLPGADPNLIPSTLALDAARKRYRKRLSLALTFHYCPKVALFRFCGLIYEFSRRSTTHF